MVVSQNKKTNSFHRRVITVIKKVPRGRVATYGQIAALAGNPRAARQVVRVLHSSSDKERLPWHRVINSKGCISLKPGRGYEMQRAMLADEGIVFKLDDTVDLKRYQWTPRMPARRKDQK
ncbi:MAG: MGMT family protein [Candidatus Zixiibacteriota bacterium]